jgi:heme-binding NEAT domain protein
VIQGIQSAVVDENGYVTFDIYHCSSYFVSSSLIEGAAGIVAEPEPEPTPTPTVEPTPEPTEMPTPTPAPEPNPETSEPVQTNGFPLVVLVAVGLGTALIGVLITMIVFRVGPFTKKRKRNSEY